MQAPLLPQAVRNIPVANKIKILLVNPVFFNGFCSITLFTLLSGFKSELVLTFLFGAINSSLFMLNDIRLLSISLLLEN